MNNEEILSWCKNEFYPINLVTSDNTITQIILNARRYWNTHSAMKYAEMLTVTSDTSRIQISANMKTAVKVLPTPPAEWLTQNYPQWSLLGISMLDSVNSDVIMMTEAFKNYKGYIGGDFKWHFERSSDPTVGGYIYMYNLPQNVQKIYVLGTKRYADTEDIVDEQVLVWLLPYVKALLKQAEGNALRKSDILGVKNDGQTIYQEGREEMLALQKSLSEEGRWVAIISRQFG